MLDPAIFGKTVRLKRQTKGLTQEQLANKAGISLNALKRIENESKPNPTQYIMYSIADALRTPVSVLMGERVDTEVLKADIQESRVLALLLVAELGDGAV